MTTTVAVLGTGTMGAGMARSCRREGLTVRAWNRTRSKAEPLADDGVVVCDSAAEAVAGADVVVVMLFDEAAVLDVLDAAGAAGAGAVWLQSATVGPEGAERIDAAARERGLAVLDAPVLGTKAPAESGSLVYLLSGDADAVERARPALDAMSSRVVVAGSEPGAASALKLVCNAWVVSLNTAVAQSVALAQGLGLDPQQFLDAIEGGPTDSGYAHVKTAAMVGGDYAPSFALDGVRKDLGLITAAAQGVGADTRVLDAMDALYADASAAGHGEEDMAAVREAFTRT